MVQFTPPQMQQAGQLVQLLLAPVDKRFNHKFGKHISGAFPMQVIMYSDIKMLMQKGVCNPSCQHWLLPLYLEKRHEPCMPLMTIWVCQMIIQSNHVEADHVSAVQHIPGGIPLAAGPSMECVNCFGLGPCQRLTSLGRCHRTAFQSGRNHGAPSSGERIWGENLQLWTICWQNKPISDTGPLFTDSTPLHALETTISTPKDGTLCFSFYQKPLGQRKWLTSIYSANFRFFEKSHVPTSTASYIPEGIHSCVGNETTLALTTTMLRCSLTQVLAHTDCCRASMNCTHRTF